MPFDLIPQPRSITERSGTFVLSADVRISATGAAEGPAWLLHDAIRTGTGVRLPVLPDPGGARSITLTVRDGSDVAAGSTAMERYSIDITPDTVDIVADHPAGLARAVSTVRQLLPADSFRAAPIHDGPAELPCVQIDDEPRFSWRGVMLDVARHFQPKEVVLRFIDLAAAHRLNVVHLHLTDDQGWRLEVPGWPRLTEVGSWRSETVVGHANSGQGSDGTPHGGYYTADDLREIVTYAAARHITVVPEIDLPGHVRSALAGYPELGNTGDELPVETSFGVFPQVLAPTEASLRFARDVFDTVVGIFDSPLVHIGGDECPRTEWHESPAAKDRIAELGLDGVEAIQPWFTSAFADHLRSHGRRVIGWDEILDGGAPDDAVISVWRDFSTAEVALAAGHDVIVAPHDAVYLNYYPSAGPDEPLHIHGLVPLETIAAFDPAPERRGGAGRGRVIGVQAQLWSEYLPTPRAVEYAAFPRLAAVADMAWSTMPERQANPVAERLRGHLRRLDALGVNYRPLDGPHPWQKGGTGARARYDH